MKDTDNYTIIIFASNNYCLPNALQAKKNVSQNLMRSNTTETGRLFFFQRGTRQLLLARKQNVLGHVEKRT